MNEWQLLVYHSYFSPQIRYRISYATMPMMRLNRSGVASMALDDLFQLLQWVVSELMQRLHHPTATPDEVTVWVSSPGPRTPPAPAAPEPESPP